MLWSLAVFLFGIALLGLLARPLTWRLPVFGHVARLIVDNSEDAGGCGDDIPDLGVHWVSWSGPLGRRFRLNRKTPAHLAGLLIHSRPRVWKRLRQVGFSGISLPDHTRRRCDHADGGSMSMTELG